MIAELQNCALVSDIRAHLSECDKDFVPRLSNRVSIDDYALKLFNFATRFELWEDQKLVGLTAAYFPSGSIDLVFITNVSVLPTFRGKGIGERLLRACIRAAGDAGHESLHLEVDAANAPAISLYVRLGFSPVATTEASFGQVVRMVLSMERSRL